MNAALEADRRLMILRLLAEAPDYRANTYLLASALSSMGHAVGADRQRTDLAWLDEQGLVARETVGGIAIARLSERGADVAAGRAVTPGVRRPTPGE